MVTTPLTLSPSKASTFTQCPRRYRYQAIEGLVEPATAATVTGTIVHRALELLFAEHPAGQRTAAAAGASLQRAQAEAAEEGELPTDALSELADRCQGHLERYLALEDPNTVAVEATEAWVEAPLPVGDAGPVLRGILDRVDRLADGRLAIVDYKTGRVPGPRYVAEAFMGLRTYAWLLEAATGQVVDELRLYYLARPQVLSEASTPVRRTAQANRLASLWRGIERACRDDDFPPRRGPLCRYCAFESHCPGPAPSGMTLGSPTLEGM